MNKNVIKMLLQKLSKTALVLCVSFFALSFTAQAQNNTSYWQQHVNYEMEIDMDVKTFQYDGKQKLTYTNNSPEALDKVYYHLYFNAFQPGSEMDVRSLTIADPDRRVGDRISKLTPDKIGYIKVNSLEQDGKKLSYEVAGTVLEVKLDQPIAPGASTTFEMDFKGQVPEQIRRSGRNNKEGVALSMTQWYPKMAEYDFEGWHADPYIAREFHGVWGDFDVKIKIDKAYTVGGTGYLQDPEDMGHGYAGTSMEPGKNAKRGKLEWHFKAPKVHDFTWAADPEYVHDVIKGENDVDLHFFYKDNPEIKENWKKLQPMTADLLAYFNKNIGEYPYKQYSVIQGGDGGMEYAMCTLITGNRKFGSLFGVTAHEMAHTWFQFLLASNEAKHEWMDEGFTSYISSLAENELTGGDDPNPLGSSYRGYYYLVNSGKEQPQTTHADRYNENTPYSIAAYSKGAIFLSQLGYVIGKEKLDQTIKKYFNDFAFKHPTPNDIKRTAEKVSGMELDWYLTDWTQTTNTIDYGITSVEEVGGKTKVTLTRKSLMPMPIDLYVEKSDGTQLSYYIPLRMMRSEKTNQTPQIQRIQLEDWPWTNPTYSFMIDAPLSQVKMMTIDPTRLMADIDQEDNTWIKE